jgi:hypothetical protein
MATESIEFDIRTQAAQKELAALRAELDRLKGTMKSTQNDARNAAKSIDSTFASAGKSIEGVKSTMEKVFAGQAIYASASRLADAIREVTKELDATTTALNNLQQSNARGGVGFDVLAAQAKTARAEAEKLRKEYDTIGGRLSALAKYGSVKGGLETADMLEREAQIAEKQADLQKEALADRKAGVELEDRLLKARMAGEKEVADIRKNMIDQENAATQAGLAAAIKAGEEEAARVMKRDEERRKNKASMEEGIGGASSDAARRNKGRAGLGIGDSEDMGAALAEVQSMLDALAGTRPGQQSGGAREARRAQSLNQQAAEAEALGNTYDAAQLRERASRAEARAADRLDRNEARSMRQQALDERRNIGRGGDISGPLERAKALEEKAAELEKTGSTKKTGEAGGKTITDVWTVLNTRLPAKTS